MNVMQKINNRTLLFLAGSLWIMEWSITVLAAGRVIQLLVPLYIWLLFYYPGLPVLVVTACLITALSFAATGLWGIDLIYLVPLTVGVLLFHQSLQRSSFLLMVTLGFTLIMQYLLTCIALRVSPLAAAGYTALMIAATMGLFSVFLKYKIRGKQDNRS